MLGFVSLSAPKPNIKHSQIKHWHRQANLRLLHHIWGNIKHSLICSWKCGTRLRKLFPRETNEGKGEWCWDQIYNWALEWHFKGHFSQWSYTDSTHTASGRYTFPLPFIPLSTEIPLGNSISVPVPSGIHLFILMLPSYGLHALLIFRHHGSFFLAFAICHCWFLIMIKERT